MKSFSELKRTVKPGSRIKVVKHWLDEARKDLPPMAGTVRVVTKAQGNGYYYTDPNGKRVWGDYPKTAKDIRFNEDGTFAIRFGDKGEVVLRLESA